MGGNDMKNFGTIGQRYCAAKQQNVPVEIWWDNDGVRREQCLQSDQCAHKEGFLGSTNPPCGTAIRQDPPPMQ